MADKATETKGARRSALRVLLVVDRDERRFEVKAALAALTDPPLEIVDAERGFTNGGNGGAPPADVEMVVFDTEEEAPLNHLRERAAIRPGRRCSRSCLSVRRT